MAAEGVLRQRRSAVRADRLSQATGCCCAMLAQRSRSSSSDSGSETWPSRRRPDSGSSAVSAARWMPDFEISPGSGPFDAGCGVGPECACDRESLVGAGAGDLGGRPYFTNRVGPDRRECVGQRGVDLDAVCGDVSVAALADAGPRLFGRPQERRRNVVGDSEGCRPAALPQVVGEATRRHLSGLSVAESAANGLAAQQGCRRQTTSRRSRFHAPGCRLRMCCRGW